jgi:hypothetical protein
MLILLGTTSGNSGKLGIANDVATG